VSKASIDKENDDANIQIFVALPEKNYQGAQPHYMTGLTPVLSIFSRGWGLERL
jgi:hypothetical protein